MSAQEPPAAWVDRTFAHDDEEGGRASKWVVESRNQVSEDYERAATIPRPESPEALLTRIEQEVDNTGHRLHRVKAWQPKQKNPVSTRTWPPRYRAEVVTAEAAPNDTRDDFMRQLVSHNQFMFHQMTGIQSQTLQYLGKQVTTLRTENDEMKDERLTDLLRIEDHRLVNAEREQKAQTNAMWGNVANTGISVIKSAVMGIPSTQDEKSGALVEALQGFASTLTQEDMMGLQGVLGSERAAMVMTILDQVSNAAEAEQQGQAAGELEGDAGQSEQASPSTTPPHTGPISPSTLQELRAVLPEQDYAATLGKLQKARTRAKLKAQGGDAEQGQGDAEAPEDSRGPS